MSAQAMRFRLGLFVLAALGLLGALLALFGSIPTLGQSFRRYLVTFSNAPGIAAGTPVRRSGVRIGQVKSVALDDQSGQVCVLILVETRYTIHRNDQATLVHGLLGGDTSIDVIPRPGAGPGADRSPVPDGETLRGTSQADVGAVMNQASGLMAPAQDALKDLGKSLQTVSKIAPLLEDTLREYRALGKATRDMVPAWKGLAQATGAVMPEWGSVAKVTRDTLPEWRTLARAVREMVPELRELARETRQAVPGLQRTGAEFQVTAQNWGKLGEHLDVLVKTNEQRLDQLLGRLDQTLARMGGVLSEENQGNVAVTLKNVRAGSDHLEGIGKNTEDLLQQSQQAVRRLGDTMARADEVLASLQQAIKPVPDRSERILKNMEESSDRLNKLLGDLRDLVRCVATTDSSLRRFYTDPSLYLHLNDAACMLTRILPRTDCILRDLQVFADKLARHPELIGIGGVVRPSGGLKESPSTSLYGRTPGQ